MTAFLKTLLALTAAGTLCGLFLAVLRKLSKGKIPNSFLYVAWIIVVLRFAVPVNGLIPVGNSASHVNLPEASYSEPQAETGITVVSTYSRTDVPPQPVQNESVTEQFTPLEKKTVSIPTILFIVWCCGAAGFLLWNMISYARFKSLMRKGLSRPSRHDIELYDEVYSARKPILKRSRITSAPLTFGIVNPILIIPDTEYEDVALKNVFRHEIIHFRRHDILLKWFFLLVFSAHWFNPFVCYFRKEIDRVCELSCDETLLKRMNADEKRRYGETLLKIAEDSCTAPCRMITGFSEGKKDLKERLIQIMSFKKKSKAAIALALVPVLILCGCAVALGPKTDKTPKAKTVTVSNVDELLAAIAPNVEIRAAAGTYNLTEATNYGKNGASEYYHWNNYGFEGQYELCVDDVDGLSIVGDGAEIVTVPRSSNVLAFRKCDRLNLSGLTVGHTEAAEHCEGGVIRLESCVDAVVDNCRLYGCGTVGVWAEHSSDLKVKDTEIYHCSSAGISFSEAKSLSVDGCKIYDCGGEGAYQQAVGAFLFYNASDVAVRKCEIYDNYLQTLIQGSPRQSTFDNISVHDNHIKNVFYDGGLQFSNLSFNNNIVDKWIGSASQNDTISIDGAEISEAELVKMWGAQMSSAGVGEVQAEAVQVDYTDAREVHVSTADEFLAAIHSDTHIMIDVPLIDLTEASEYPAKDDFDYATPKFDGKPYAWQDVYDGSALCLGNLYNFHISGGEIVTQPRYANVLSFYECKNISLTDVHLGHNKLPGNCMGGVLYLEGCQNVLLESCDLYGCGILGIRTRHVSELHV